MGYDIEIVRYLFLFGLCDRYKLVYKDRPSSVAMGNCLY